MYNLPEELIICIYSYNKPHEIEYINKLGYIQAKKIYKNAKNIINNTIYNYLNDYKIILNNFDNDEYNFTKKIIWKKYYPLRFRQSTIELALTKLNFDDERKQQLENLITNNRKFFNQNYIKFINLLTIEEIQYNGW